MEMLYRIKLDYESKGEASELATLFSRACRELEDNVGYSSRSHHRLRLLDEQISELRTVLGCDELSPGECYPACPGEDGVPFAAMSLQNSQPQAANADSTAIPKEHGGRSLLQDAIARSRPKSIGTHSCRTVKHTSMALGEQLTTVGKPALRSFVVSLNPGKIREIEKAVKAHLGLTANSD